MRKNKRFFVLYRRYAQIILYTIRVKYSWDPDVPDRFHVIITENNSRMKACELWIQV